MDIDDLPLSFGKEHDQITIPTVCVSKRLSQVLSIEAGILDYVIEVVPRHHHVFVHGLPQSF